MDQQQAADPRVVARQGGAGALVDSTGLPVLRRQRACIEGVVVGLYHHKSDAPLTRNHVKEQARKLGFDFPVAIDANWETLRRWWLSKNKGGWTSVTFLLDRDGVIRHIHPGGAFYQGEPGYEALQRALNDLCQQPISRNIDYLAPPR